MTIFDHADSLGSQSNEDIADFLTLIDDLDNAQHFVEASVSGQAGIFPTRAWKHVGTSLGFIHPTPDPKSGLFQVQHASTIQDDPTLAGQLIKITLDSFYVDSYPGRGVHDVLFDFSGKGLIDQNLEEIRHPLNIKVNDGAHANVAGSAIFVGLNVDQNGVTFEGRTINVKSNFDQQIISTFESKLFKSGLTLINTAKPILKPYTALTLAAITAIAKRSENVQVHNFHLGLHFGQNPTSNKLRTGSYVVIQSDDPIDFSEISWNQATASLVYQHSPSTSINFNYLIIGVSLFQP